MYHMLLPMDRNEERSRAQTDYVRSCPVDFAALEVTILHVLPRSDATTSAESTFGGNDSAVVAANMIQGEGITTHRRLESGGPVAETILEVANDEGVDEIVMGVRKRSDLEKTLLGSTASAVIRAASRPVVLTG
mgnify:CR=1 FL=1